MYIFKLYVVKNCIAVTLGYFCMATNISPGDQFLHAAQTAQYRPHLLYHVHTALAVLSIHSTILCVFSPAHFLSTTHALCVPFACLYRHRKRCLKDGSYLCVALFAMTSARTGLDTSTAFAPCTPETREPLTFLPTLWAWHFPAGGITRIAPQILGFTPG